VPTKITITVYVTTWEFTDGWQQNLIQVLKNSKKKLFSHSSFQLHHKVLISAIVEDVHVFMQAAVAYLSQSTKVVKTNGTQILFPNHYFLSHVIFNTIKQKQSQYYILNL
jgi:hypothetical protein